MGHAGRGREPRLPAKGSVSQDVLSCLFFHGTRRQGVGRPAGAANGLRAIIRAQKVEESRQTSCSDAVSERWARVSSTSMLY